MKINKRRLAAALKEVNITGKTLVKIFKNLETKMNAKRCKEVFVIALDKDNSAITSELLPEIIFRLKEKE